MDHRFKIQEGKLYKIKEINLDHSLIFKSWGLDSQNYVVAELIYRKLKLIGCFNVLLQCYYSLSIKRKEMKS